MPETNTIELFAMNHGVNPNARDHEILANSVKEFEKLTGPRLGDYIDFPDGKTRRFTHDWGTDIQTTSPAFGDGSFYFKDGWVSYSGSLDHGIQVEQIEATGETRNGNVWFFHNGEPCARNAVGARIPFRVYRLKSITEESHATKD